ncbi:MULTISPECIES: TIGR01457 family HAD-type hydrolase [unclassified Granulicatella]|uniref:TIGR01457 family HAD-type hydrolase n=1 Tax=unclassified Granulicatella TaxID=2630493 RepID=UPI0010743150|nr:MULTISPECIES: TIGR01457 family HAD-type hydrolase [unclassified Granulicatella]MBF0780058.1 TIGR01457 family HAD-type hydrolase [Granulicatella sp. 19428wC4_WM01]TFU95844.1 TIGR01457 family HAD-type hydrolase [Granulicatella sp. WM01]
MRRYKGYLIDLDGTLYIGKKRLYEAEQFINTLLKKDIPFLCVTNNSTRSPNRIALFLKEKFNIIIDESFIYTSGLASIDYLKKQTIERIMVIGEDDLKQQIVEAGFILDNCSPQMVIQGLDRACYYNQIKEACFAIQQGATYVLTNSDEQYPTEKGFIPGAGAIAKIIIATTKITPLLIGKPSSIIMNGAVNKIGLAKQDLLMIGDNYNTDILAGINNGIDTLLTLTGVTQRKDLARVDIQPTYIVNHLGEWTI